MTAEKGEDILNTTIGLIFGFILGALSAVTVYNTWQILKSKENDK